MYQQGITAQNDGNYSQAESIWRKVLELLPKDATAYFYLAKALSLQKKLEEAIAAYQRAIKLNPNDIRAYNNLGLELTENKKLDEAIAAYPRDAIVALFSFGAATLTYLLSFLIENISKSNSK